MQWSDEEKERREEIRRRLQHLLETHRGLAAWLSRTYGIPESSISNWKSPSRSDLPDIHEAGLLCDAAGAGLDWLFFGRERDHREQPEIRAIITMLRSDPERARALARALGVEGSVPGEDDRAAGE